MPVIAHSSSSPPSLPAYARIAASTPSTCLRSESDSVHSQNSSQASSREGVTERNRSVRRRLQDRPGPALGQGMRPRERKAPTMPFDPLAEPLETDGIAARPM